LTTEDTTPSIEPDPQGEEAGDRDPAWYREQIETVTGQRDKALATLERLAFADLGLTAEAGVGKALKLTFEGEIDPEDTTALKEAAGEFGWTAEVTAPPPETTAKPDVSDAESRIGLLDKASTPAEPNALRDEGEAALEKGDVAGAIGSFVAEQMQDGTIDLGGPSGK
jgi:hypothetical protein